MFVDKKEINPNFTEWAHWPGRGKLPDLSYPGVYALAIAQDDLSGMPFSWMCQIVYVGMTNAKGGSSRGSGSLRIRSKVEMVTVARTVSVSSTQTTPS
jgi:hypothetical protein